MKIFIHRFDTISNKLNSVILSNQESKAIEFFIGYLNTKSFELDRYFDILDTFSKQICKTKNILSEKKIKQKILHQDFASMIEKNKETFVTWILS
jgi:hypothetical protein